MLVHLLPGLALFAHRRFVTPQGWQQWLQAAVHALAPAAGTSEALAASEYGRIRRSAPPLSLSQSALWLFCVPLLFYCIWQLAYFIVVQVWPQFFSKSRGATGAKFHPGTSTW